jgi:translation initiation factor 2 alpha subunit (eIF-2alpha)
MFTNRLDNCFECFLTDFNKKAVMPFHMATMKSNMKHKNINTLAPLNKPFVGIVEDIIDDTIIVSMAFIDKDALEYKLFLEETSKNKVLAINVRKYTTKNNISYNDYWERVIYPIDRMRMESNESEFNLFDYILNNVDSISQDGNLDKSIIETLSNISLKTTVPCIKFKLVSTNGIDNIKKMIDMALDVSKTKDILEVMIESAPHYYVSSKETTDTTHHKKFIDALENLAKNIENNIYISL